MCTLTFGSDAICCIPAKFIAQKLPILKAEDELVELNIPFLRW